MLFNTTETAMECMVFTTIIDRSTRTQSHCFGSACIQRFDIRYQRRQCSNIHDGVVDVNVLPFNRNISLVIHAPMADNVCMHIDRVLGAKLIG